MISSFFTPKQPVTNTLSFSANASPMVSKDYCTAESMKPQVFTPILMKVSLLVILIIYLDALLDYLCT